MNDNKTTPPSVILSAEARKQVTDVLEAIASGEAGPNICARSATKLLALLASLPEAPAVEAKPSVQGLMELAEDYARAWMHDVDGSFVVKDQATKAKAKLRAYAESLEASRIAPEGQANHIADASKMVGGVPPGEWGGLSPKQAWWAGYRVGKGLPPDMPRSEAVAAEAVPAQADMTDAEIDAVLLERGTTGKRQVWFTRAEVVNIARAILSARKDRGDALLLKVYQHLQRFAADSDIIDEVRDYLEGE